MRTGLGRAGGLKAFAAAVCLALSLGAASQAHAQPDPQEALDGLTERIEAVTGQLEEGAEALPAALEAKVDRKVERAEELLALIESGSDRAVERAEGLLEHLLATVEETVELAAAAVDNTVDEAGKLLRSEQGLLTTASNVLCPAVRDLEALIDRRLPIPGVGEITGAVASLVCIAGILEFQFQTTWVAPDGGTITRLHDATIGIPTHMNVDAVPGPDIVGELNLAGGLGYLEMSVDKLDPAQELPLSVEAVFSDTAESLLGVDHMAFGYDTTHDQAPGGFVLSTALDGVTGSGGDDMTFNMQQFGLTEEIALIASTFDGTPVDREEDMALRLDYGNAPGWAQITAGLDEAIGLELRANTVGPAELSAQLGSDDSLNVEFEDLPEELALSLDPDSGAIGYSASALVDRLEARMSFGEPFMLGANDLEARMLDLPLDFELTIGEGDDGISVAATNPIGQLDIRARSAGQAYPEIPAGEAGIILHSSDDDLALALRIFELQEIVASFDPVALDISHSGGRVFTLDASLAEGGSSPVEVFALIDEIPDQMSIGLGELPEPPDGPGGQALTMEAGEPIELIRFAIGGFELLEGAASVEAALHQVPTEVMVAMPQEGALVQISANDHIGQMRLGASDAPGSLPDRSIGGDPVLNDLLGMKDVPGEFGAALRLTALQHMAVGLDPIGIQLAQDGDLTRPLEIDAGLEVGGDEAVIAGELRTPGDSTSLSVEMESDEPARVVFDNSQNLELAELTVGGIEGLGDVAIEFENVSPQMMMCMDPGPGCQRENLNPITSNNGDAVNGRPYPAEMSLDFDDFGTHGAGEGPDFHTTLNAAVEIGGDVVGISDLKFRNLSMDFGQGPPASCLGMEIPRIYMFFDSRSHPFVIGGIEMPPMIEDFVIGTEDDPARAHSRTAWFRGVTLCIFPQRSSAGAMDCGGAASIQTELGDVLDFPILGALVPLCGGTVPDPQPW